MTDQQSHGTTSCPKTNNQLLSHHTVLLLAISVTCTRFDQAMNTCNNRNLHSYVQIFQLWKNQIIWQ